MADIDPDNPFTKYAVQPSTPGIDPDNPFAKYAAPAGPTPNKYQQAALDDAAKAKANGQDTSYGVAARALNGAMFEGLPTVAAAAETPFAMLQHGTLSPSEGYNYAKAGQDLSLADSQKNLGIAGTVADIGGSVLSGSTLANAGVTLARPGATVLGSQILGTAAGMAGDGAAYGGLSGALGGGDSLQDRAAAATKGAMLGGVVGGTLPLAGAAIGTAASPITSNISARMNPEGFATNQLARAVSESGQTPDQLGQALSDASAAGQPQYTLADALGNPGQRMLSTVTRSPGAGRTDAVNFLENRQAGQGRDLSNQIADALAAPDTAAQRAASLEGQRSTDAAANYGAARGSAGAVDVTPAIQAADNFLSPGASGVFNPSSTIADDSIEAAVRQARGRLVGQNGEQLSDFDASLRAKQEIDNQIENGSPSQQRQLIPIRNALDNQLAAASQPYANARNTFRQQSGAIDAIDTGRSAAMRGRPEDTIPAFNALPNASQSAYRAGYADPLIEGIVNAAPGVNKARGLMNDGTAAELNALSLHNGPFQPGAPTPLDQSINRSNTMFQTRQAALGGSKTADNLADQAASGLDPVMIAHALTGGTGGLVHGALRVAGNTLSGATPQVRQALGRMLLMHGPNADVAGALGGAVNNQARVAALARGLVAGGQMAGSNLIADRNSAVQ